MKKLNSNITAILPAYNEEIAIGSMVLRTKKYVDKVIVVDDGSEDNTADIAKLAGAYVITHPKNLGKGAAMKTGFKEAKDADIIVMIDADGQNNPSDIPALVSPIIENEADMVNGSRYINNNNKDTPYYRRVGQNVLDMATNFNSGLKITDSQSGFRAFSSSTFNAFRFNNAGFGIESEMLAEAAKAGFRIKEVEVGVRYDVDCSTENPVSHGVRVLVNILHDMELNRPLYYFTLPGFIMGIVGLGLGLNFLRDFYLGGSLMFGPTLLMIILTLVGTFATFTGIILHSMSRMINEIQIKRDD